MKYLASTVDCSIKLDEKNNLGPVKVLSDEEGLELWKFDPAMTDLQIRAALAFANDAYAKGFAAGQQARTQEPKAGQAA